MTTITKNGRSLGGGDVKINMLGIVDIYADSIEYSIKQEHQHNYGLHRKPRTYSMGKVSYEGKITLMLEDVAAIQNANNANDNNSLIDIPPFWIVVTIDPNVENVNNILPPTVDMILAKFQNTGKKIGNEMGIKQEFELFVLNIKENVPM